MRLRKAVRKHITRCFRSHCILPSHSIKAPKHFAEAFIRHKLHPMRIKVCAKQISLKTKQRREVIVNSMADGGVVRVAGMVWLLV
jgi:hypothetical protein